MNRYKIIYLDFNEMLCAVTIEADTEYEAKREFTSYYVHNRICSIEKE